MTITIAMTITHDPNIDTIVLQFPAMPVASATTSARLATFTSSGCQGLGVIGIAGTDEQADRQRQQNQQVQAPDDVPIKPVIMLASGHKGGTCPAHAFR
jgi:hypothetical protein